MQGIFTKNTIYLHEPSIDVVLIVDRLERLDPEGEIYIVFHGDFSQRKISFRYEERKAEPTGFVPGLGSYSEKLCREQHECADEPDPTWRGDDEEVDIGIFVCRIHGERIGDCHHPESGNPPDEADEILGFLEKLLFVRRRSFFDTENGFEFFCECSHEEGDKEARQV